MTVLGLVVLSALFSSSETALFTLQADPSDEGPRHAALRALRADPHRLLVTILLGNNVVNVAVASVTTALLLEVLPPGGAVTAATVLASVVVLVFGEIVPKSYGLANARSWSLTVARPLVALEWLLTPLVWLFDLVTRRLTRLVGGEAVEAAYDEAPERL